MNREKEWDKQQTIQLINALQKHPCIWDVNADDHRDKRRKYISYVELASMFGCTNIDIERKVSALRAGYRRELKKEMAAKSAGLDTYETKWIFYKHLAFLNPRTYASKTNFNTSPEEVEDESYETPQSYEYEVEISDEDNTTFTQTCSEINNKKKRSHSSICDQKFYDETAKLLKLIQEASQQRAEAPAKDDCDTFAANVAVQLRNLKSDYAKSSAKLNIQKALFEAEQLDMNIFKPPTTSLTNTNAIPALPVSTLAQPSASSKTPSFIKSTKSVLSSKTAPSERIVTNVLNNKTGPLVLNTSSTGKEFPQAQHFLICTKTNNVNK